MCKERQKRSARTLRHSWDAENRPATLNGYGLTVDALGRIVEKNSSGSYLQYVYSPTGRKIAVYVGQTLHRTYIPLPAGAEVKYGSSGISAYAHADWLGSIRVASSPSRTVLADIPYAPYGETYSRTGTYSPEFTGNELDITSPLYDFMFREHNYTQGRWVSPDPAGMGAVNPTDPQTWNRYAYVGNTPLTSVDADGLVTLPGCEEGDFSCGLGGGLGDGCGELGGPEGDLCTLLLPPVWIWGGGSGGTGSGGSGSGGGVGTGGSGGGTSGGSPSSISFPNGENLGLPTGYNFKPLNIFQLLGLQPQPGCEFGPCSPGMFGFLDGGAALSGPGWWQNFWRWISGAYWNFWPKKDATVNFCSEINGLDGKPKTRVGQAAGPNPYNPNGGEEQWDNFQNVYSDQCQANGNTPVCRSWAGIYGPQAVCQCCK